MRHKFIRNAFLVACASLTLSNAYAMLDSKAEDGRSQVVKKPESTIVKDQWIIKEYKDYTIQQKDFSKLIDISSEKKEDFIQYILIGRIRYSTDIFIDVIPRLDQPSKTSLNISHDLQSTHIVYQDHGDNGWSINWPDEVTPAKFLSVFYNRGLIPDGLINHIIQPFDIKDFRENTNGQLKRTRTRYSNNLKDDGENNREGQPFVKKVKTQ